MPCPVRPLMDSSSLRKVEEHETWWNDKRQEAKPTRVPSGWLLIPHGLPSDWTWTSFEKSSTNCLSFAKAYWLVRIDCYVLWWCRNNLKTTSCISCLNLHSTLWRDDRPHSDRRWATLTWIGVHAFYFNVNGSQKCVTHKKHVVHCRSKFLW